MVLQLSFMVSSQLEYPLINVSTIGLDGPFVVVRCGGVMKRYWRRVLSWAQIIVFKCQFLKIHVVMPIDNVHYDSVETLVDCVVCQWNT